MPLPRTTILGEFSDPGLEERFRARNADHDRRRMIVICVVTSIAYLLGFIIDYIDLGSGAELLVMTISRIVVFAFGMSAALILKKKVMSRIEQYALMIYMIMVGISEALEVSFQYHENTGVIVPTTLIIALMFYLFIPVRLIVSFIPAVFMSVVYIVSVAFFTPAGEGKVIDLTLFFLIANGYGVYHVIAFSRIRRHEFYALIKEQQLVAEVRKEIGIRQEAEKKLLELASIDDLTGANNRRHFLKLFEIEIKRADRYNYPLSLMMIDADHFKSINDTYGHDVGDMVLIHLSNTITALLRETDILARFGGEEFIALLPNTDLNNARDVAERICSSIANSPVAVSGKTIPVTISIGVSSLCGKCPTMENMIKVADDALYRAKDSGRNRVVTMREIGFPGASGE